GQGRWVGVGCTCENLRPAVSGFDLSFRRVFARRPPAYGSKDWPAGEPRPLTSPLLRCLIEAALARRARPPAACPGAGTPALCSRAPHASRALRVAARWPAATLDPWASAREEQALTGRRGGLRGGGARAPAPGHVISPAVSVRA